MYTIMKQVIEAGGYDLPTMLGKVSTAWARGSLTTEQQEELEALARSCAQTQGSVDVLKKLEELEGRLRALENAGGTAGADYPAYVEGKWYYAGDTCSFEGINYTCIAPAGVVCVWSPAAYPAYWQAV